MKSFLENTAEEVFKKHSRLEDAVLVFPNRRAILYFRKHLSKFLVKPSFSPTMITIEEFFGSCSPLKVPDKLELIGQLFLSYNEIMRFHVSEESSTIDSLDRFYFWGEMLLRDFEEVDKYMINAAQLFQDLSHQKELDSTFDYLTEEQKKFLSDFWGGFQEHDSINKKKFLSLWRKLFDVYAKFKDRLHSNGMAFEGMLHRDVAEAAAQGKLNFPYKPADVSFIGFNALTQAEEKTLSAFVKNGGNVYWDFDAYYVNNITQEAGRFFREYQDHPILKQTFAADVPSNLSHRTDKPAITVIGAAQPIGQAKAMAQLLGDQLAEGALPEETLIVLPDEKLLMPVLHGVSSAVDKLNVTMGFPITSSPMFNFIELILDLQISRKLDCFNHRQVLAVLGHPYAVAADAASGNAKRKEILKNNWVQIPASYLGSEVPLHRLVFQQINRHDQDSITESLIAYLQPIIEEVGSLRTLTGLDKEFAFHFHRFFNQLKKVVEATSVPTKDDKGAAKSETQQLKSFIRLFRQLVKTIKVPFSGEPLAGLQLMGVLETRNLDFKNVFVLSLNEGVFPSSASKTSYVPHSIRRAYGLPTIEHQDAIYSYLFYRVLQRAENIFLFYNSETDVLGQGEMSRYLQQLIFESGFTFDRKTLHNTLAPRAIQPIVVRKNRMVMDILSNLSEGNRHFRGISPSALNTYIECRLKFYFRYVAKVREPDLVEEELDARVLGNFLHDVMEAFYKGIVEKKNSKEVIETDLDGFEAVVDNLIHDAFIKNYKLDPSRKVVYEGQRLVVREVVKKFAHRIIEMDRRYAPFAIEGLEQEGLNFSVKMGHAPFQAVIGGKIDRVDRKEKLVRVIDYKTGKDKLSFDTVASLFLRDGKRNKAAFQTLLYAMLYKRNFPWLEQEGLRLVPGLINRMNLFDQEFSFGLKVGNETIKDVNPLLQEFESHLISLFDELYDPEQVFDQTQIIEDCKICPYSRICYR